MVAVCGLSGNFAAGAENGPIAAQMDTFTAPDGANYFALSMKPAATAPDGAARDIVVLFNTSASQQGDYRVKSLDTLKGFLAGLGAGDRVRLVAVDVNAIALTKTFVAPNSSEMAEAIKELDARVPLGATDMEKAVEAVLGSFMGESKNPRAAVYIGDGRSAANLLGTETFEKLASQLADARIAVSSYAIGSRVYFPLIGALAAQTGGTVIGDSETLAAPDAGRLLSGAADASVLWPTAVAWPASVTEVFPKRLPPMRSDRETVVLGTFKGKEPLNVQVSADGVAGPQKLAFSVTPSASDDGNSYLAMLIDQARIDGGVTLPLVGTASLAERVGPSARWCII